MSDLASDYIYDDVQEAIDYAVEDGRLGAVRADDMGVYEMMDWLQNNETEYRR